MPGSACGRALNFLADRVFDQPGDVVDVSVYDVPELSHTYTVSPSGTVTVPLLPHRSRRQD